MANTDNDAHLSVNLESNQSKQTIGQTQYLAPTPYSTPTSSPCEQSPSKYYTNIKRQDVVYPYPGITDTIKKHDGVDPIKKPDGVDSVEKQEGVDSVEKPGVVDPVKVQTYKGDTNCDGHQEHDHDGTQQSFADQMIKNSTGTSNKNYKKLMKKVQSDPRLRELINDLHKNPSQVKQQAATSPRDKLRAKLEEQSMRRRGQKAQQIYRDRKAETNKKKTEAIQKQEKTEEQKNEELKNATQQQISSSIQDAKKKERNQKTKLNKLQKKLGQISFERYSEALKFLSNLPESVKENEINREKNIMDLYLKQNPPVVEKQLDFYEDDLSNQSDLDCDDIEDLEK